jgi:hypothetical protein
LTGRFLGTLQPGLATLPVLLTVAAAGVGVLLLVTRHGLAVDHLAGPPVALVLSATATALVWAGLALDAASLLLLVPALPAVGVVLLSALRGPAGYRTGLLLGWWWGLVATGGSLLVFGVYLAVVYGQAWAGLVIVGVAVALVAAWWALRKAPAGS